MISLLDADWNHWPEQVDEREIANRIATLGLDGVELGVYDPAEELSTQRLDRWRRALDEHQLRIGAVLLSLPPERWPDGALCAADTTALLTAVEACGAIAAGLGLDRIGLWPGADAPGGDTAAVAVLPQVADVAARYGLRIGIEPKPDTLWADPSATLELVDAADVRGVVGVLLDTGHELAGGRDPAALAEEIGDDLVHVHVGDSDGDADADLPAGRIHSLAPFLGALDAIGYDGAVSPDLYGCVLDGVAGAVDAVTESIAHVRAAEVAG